MTDTPKPAEPAHDKIAEMKADAAFGPPAHKNPEGLDYASVDENPAPDEAAVVGAGEKFVIIRKSYGFWDPAHRAFRLAPDPNYARDAARARAAGIVVGAYMFPIFHIHAPSAAEQFANFVAAEGDIIPGKDLPPTIDVEFPGNGISDTGMTQGQAYTFLLELVALFKAKYGCDPMIYTSHVEWCDTNGLGGPKDLAGHDCPLWVKIPYHLAAHRAPDTAPHADPHLGYADWDKADLYRIPPPWEKSGWFIRQYQGDAIGLAGVHQADLDDFHVTWQGDTGPQVMWIQRRLGVAADGMFGPVTAAALAAFQKAHELEADEIVGLGTFAALAWA